MINVNNKKITGFIVLFLCILGIAQSQQQLDDFNKYLNLAKNYQNINSDSVLKYTGIAFDIAQEIPNPDLQLIALQLIIKTRIKKGEYSKALNICFKADSIAAGNQLEDHKIENLMYKGLVFQNSGLVLEGLKLFFEANDLIIETKNNTYRSELDYYTAVAYFSINEFAKSRTYARKAFKYEIANNSSSNALKSLVLISSSFKNPDSIYKYLQLADRVSKLDSNGYKRAVLLNNKALFYKATGKVTQAKTSYLKAINISQTNGFSKHLANLYNNFAYLLMAEKKYDSANLVLQKALSISRELKNIDIEASVLDSFSDYFEKIGNPEQSLKYFRQSVKLRKKYKQQQQIERSLFLSTVFETEKKEKEIVRQDSELYRLYSVLFAFISLFAVAVAVLVYFRNKSAAREARIKMMDSEKKLDLINALIEGQDAERKRLAMDLHDGISPKIGLLRLTIDNHFSVNDAFTEISNSIDDIDHSIREISHKMLPSQLDSKGLVVALEHFIDLLNQNNKTEITFYTTLEHRLGGKYELNIYFIFYELINNALKHSGTTEVNVQLLCNGKVVRVNVEDNGNGFDTEQEFEGSGLKNIRQRVTYLNGEFVIDSVIGEGTAVLIEIKT